MPARLRISSLLVCAVVALVAVAWVQASPVRIQRAAAGPVVDLVSLVEQSPTSFAWQYHNNRPPGSSPVNAATIQITSGDTSILQSVTFAGVIGRPTNVQNAYIWYPLGIPTGSSASGVGTTSSPLPPNTTFKFFFSTDGLASAANTTSVDVQLGSPTAASHATITPGIASWAAADNWNYVLGKHQLKAGVKWTYNRSSYNGYLKQKAPLGAVKEVLHGSLTGTGTVDIAIDQLTSPNQCRWLTDGKGDFHMQACTSPVWLPANVTGKKWTFTLNRLLPPGQYTVESRASSTGTSETVFSAAQHNLVKLNVVLTHK